MSTKERIILYLKEIGIGRTFFEEKVGLSRGLISQRSKSISSDAIEKIAENFPDLNIEWLITGRGEMLKCDSGKGNNNIISGDNNRGMMAGGHNIQISDPTNGRKKIIEDGDFKLAYESMPENSDSQHIIESLKQRVTHLESENSMLKGIVEAKDKTIEFLQSLVMKLHESKS